MNDSTFGAPLFLGILFVGIWLVIFYMPANSSTVRPPAKSLVFPPVDSFPLDIAVRTIPR